MVAINVSGCRLEKQVTVTGGLASIPPARVGSWWTVLYPAEPAITGGDRHRADRGYPAASLSVLGLHMHWLIYFVLATVVFMFALRRAFRVEI